MNSQPDKEKAAGTVLKASLPFLKSDEYERVIGQLSYIVQDMKEECLQNRGRGFHMNSSPIKLGQNRPKRTLNQIA